MANIFIPVTILPHYLCTLFNYQYSYAWCCGYSYEAKMFPFPQILESQGLPESSCKFSCINSCCRVSYINIDLTTHRTTMILIYVAKLVAALSLGVCESVANMPTAYQFWSSRAYRGKACMRCLHRANKHHNNYSLARPTLLCKGSGDSHIQ